MLKEDLKTVFLLSLHSEILINSWNVIWVVEFSVLKIFSFLNPYSAEIFSMNYLTKFLASHFISTVSLPGPFLVLWGHVTSSGQ